MPAALQGAWRAHAATALFGLIVYFTLAFLDYRKILDLFATPYYLASLMLLMAVLAWGAVSVPQFYTAFGFDGVNYGFAFLLIGIALSTVQPLTGILMNAHSRRAEFRADKQAVKEGYGESLVTGLKLLAKENFAHLSPAPLLVVLEYSHPPLAKRIEKIGEAVKAVPTQK